MKCISNKLHCKVKQINTNQIILDNLENHNMDHSSTALEKLWHFECLITIPFYLEMLLTQAHKQTC